MPASAEPASPGDWGEIFDLLDTALELDPSQQVAWLESLPLDKRRLSPRLKKLLDSRSELRAGDFMRTPTAGAHHGASPPQDPAPGSLVGAYRLLRAIGQGGMASVWLAERADGLLERRVALKLPHLSWGATSFAKRMGRERNILASLTHPNIARLYDAGIADDGRPFLALEYVDGEPIDTFADARDLSVRARLELVQQVARAVAHAHAQLVVHRDLKPSNILVDAKGQAHLLDFGIAKLIDPQPSEADEAAQLTEAPGGRALTPDYASPEQLRGETIGTASDVYSLGVVAYELLTGVKPYELRRGAGASELAQSVAAVDVRRPSTVAKNASVARELRNDLDAILSKALKRDIADRYASVEAFALDIERHLANQPVEARSDSLAYRAGKFVRRNKLPVGAALAIGVSLIAGSSLALWQGREALLQAERAQRVTDFIGTVFAAADPNVAGKAGMEVRELLDAAAARVERELQREPAVAAELLGLIAESYRNLGEVDRSLSAAKRADALAAVGYSASDPMRSRLMRVLAQAHDAKGEGDEARRLLKAALEMQRRQKRPDELGLTLLAMAGVTMDQGHETEAVALTREALQRLEAAYGPDHPLSIRARGALSNKLMIAHQPQEALRQAELSVEAARRAFTASEHPAVVAQLSHYAYALSANGRSREAREQWQAIVAADRKIFYPNAPQVSEALLALGLAQTSLGELSDALKSFEEALLILRTLGIQSGGELAIRYFSLGRVALLARHEARALNALDQAIAIGSKAFGPDSARVRDAGYFRAEALLRTGRLAEAKLVIEQRVAEDRASHDPNLVRELRLLGLLYQAQGNAAAALESLQEAQALASNKQSAGPRPPPQLQAELGRAQLETGRLAQAEATLLEAVDKLRQVQPTPTPQQAEAWLALGRVRLLEGRSAEALPRLEQADAFWRGYQPEHPSAGEAAYWLARARQQSEDGRAGPVAGARAQHLSPRPHTLRKQPEPAAQRGESQ